MQRAMRIAAPRLILPRQARTMHATPHANRRFRDELDSAAERTERVLPEEMESWITFRDIKVNMILRDKAKRGIWPPAKPNKSMFTSHPEDQTLRPATDPTQFVPLSAIEETASVYDAVSKMQLAQFGAVVVLRSDSMKHLELQTKGKAPIHLQGIFTERDFLTKAFQSDKSPHSIPVADIMTKNVTTVSPETTAARCMEMMTEFRFRHLPVVDTNGLSWGIVSIGDIVKYILDEQRQTIQYLKEYIQRTY